MKTIVRRLTFYLRPGRLRLHAACRISSFPCRVFGTSSSSGNDDKVDKPKQSTLQTAWHTEGAISLGQVIFLNSTKSGSILLASLAVGDPYVAALASVGAVTANATARWTGLNATSRTHGLLGYNGALVGCAAAVFGPPLLLVSSSSSSAAMMMMTAWSTGVATTVAGSAASTFVTAALPGVLKMPQWTWSFNIVTLCWLTRSQPLLAVASTAATNAAPSEVITVMPTVSMLDLIVGAPLKGLSQIFVVESVWSGAGIVAAIATYSPQLAVHAVGGSILGSVTGVVLGAPLTEVAAGLWGYNSALTSLGVSVFFRHNPPMLALSAGGAMATAVVFGGMQTSFALLGAPCLTLPFCATMSGCYLLGSTRAIPGLELASSPHSPEQND